MKLNVLIVDDKPDEISLVKEMIEQTGVSNYVNILECLWVLKNLDSSKDLTLKQLIDSCVHFDIALIDLHFEDEFAADKNIEMGGVCAATMIKSAFPRCPILFSTKNMDYVADGSIINKFDAEYWKKGRLPISIITGKNRILSAIKKWTESILFDIKSFESSTKQCLAAINRHGVIDWNTEITINNRKWTFENLFFIYKDNFSFTYKGKEEKLSVEKLKEIILSENHGLGFMPKHLMGLKKNDIYQENLLDYYKLLYFNHPKEILIIEGIVKNLLCKLKKLIEEPSISNLNNLKTNLSGYNITSKVPLIFTDEDAAIAAFKEKLIIRLFFICAYILFGVQANVIYCFFNDAAVSDETIKQISTRLLIYGMQLKEKIEKGYLGYKTHDDSENKQYAFFKRNYLPIIKKSFMKYEKDFIINFYREIQSDCRNINEENADVIDDTINKL
jgi:CheY-like chemotaxis protein